MIGAADAELLGHKFQFREVLPSCGILNVLYCPFSEATPECSGAADDIQQQVTVWSRENERQPSGPGITAGLDRRRSHACHHTFHLHYF